MNKMNKDQVVRDHIKWCRYWHPIKTLAAFDVAMRHGAEYPACNDHVARALLEAYNHDGDHGNVIVYQIGVAIETMRDITIDDMMPYLAEAHVR